MKYKQGSKSQIALTENEFKALIEKFEQNSLLLGNAKFVLWAIKLDAAHVPGFNNIESVTYGIGMIQFDFFFKNGQQQPFWILYSQFKGLDINLENEYGYLEKYGLDLVDYVRSRTTSSIHIVADEQDLLVDTNNLQWTYIS